MRSNTNAIILGSSRREKRIPSLCSEQAMRSAVASAAWQSHRIKTKLLRPFRARNDIVKIYIVFILVLADNIGNTLPYPLKSSHIKDLTLFP